MSILVFSPNEEKYIEQSWEVKKRIYSKTGFLSHKYPFFQNVYKSSYNLVKLDDKDSVIGFLTIEPKKLVSTEESTIQYSSEDVLDEIPMHEVERRNNLATFGYMSLLGVEPTRQGDGIGKTLVDKANEMFDIIFCHVRENNNRALSFYRDYGFIERRKIIDYYEDGTDSIHLVYPKKPSKI